MEDRRDHERIANGIESPDLAVEALRALPNPPRGIDEDFALRPLALAELLFDHVHEFHWEKALHLITCATIEELDALAADHLLKERLLLDPVKLAEDTVVRLWTDHSSGTRIRPFLDWARAAVRESAKWCAQRGEIPALPRSAKTPTEKRLMSHAMNVANHLDFDARRIAWAAWVDHLTPEQIQRVTNVPVEQVEFVLQSILERAWHAMEGEQDPDQNAFQWKAFLLDKERQAEKEQKRLEEEQDSGEETGDG